MSVKLGLEIYDWHVEPRVRLNKMQEQYFEFAYVFAMLFLNGKNMLHNVWNNKKCTIRFVK